MAKAATNEHRSETVITLGGRDYEVKPDFDTLARVEAVLGKSLLEAMRDVGTGSLGLTQTVNLTRVVLRNVKGAPKPAEIGELVLQRGYPHVQAQLVGLITKAFPDDDDADDEAAAGN